MCFRSSSVRQQVSAAQDECNRTSHLQLLGVHLHACGVQTSHVDLRASLGKFTQTRRTEPNRISHDHDHTLAILNCAMTHVWFSSMSPSLLWGCGRQPLTSIGLISLAIAGGYVGGNTHTHIHTHRHTYTRTHTHAHAHIHTHVRTLTHTRTHIRNHEHALLHLPSCLCSCVCRNPS